MVSCNSVQCVRAWPSSTAMNPHYHRLPLQVSSSSDIEGINSRLNTMSMEERSQGVDDLHGVADIPDETPEMLQTKLSEMNAALALSGSSADTLPYRMALEKDAAYVERLKISCLRTTSFMSREAAALMIRFFGKKLELFGEEKLVRDLRLSDLDRPREMEAFRERGLLQKLPHPDRSGRKVLLNIGRINQEYDIEVVLRVTFYFFMMACFQEDEETQKKGFVCVYFAFGQNKLPVPRAMRFDKLMSSLPVKVGAAHVCRHDDSNGNIFKAALKYVTKVMEKRRLCRWRSHAGTQLEVMYRLMTFGIIKEALPLTNNGEIDLAYHQRMLDLLKKREEGEAARDKPTGTAKVIGIDTQLVELVEEDGQGGQNSHDNKDIGLILAPGRMDIIMGRGRQPTSTPGALTMRQVVESYREKYDAATKDEKQLITDIVLKQLKEFGCRFLMDTRTGGYIECEDKVARSKISHGFRNARIRTRVKQQKEQQRGETSETIIAKKRRVV